MLDLCEYASYKKQQHYLILRNIITIYLMYQFYLFKIEFFVLFHKLTNMHTTSTSSP